MENRIKNICLGLIISMLLFACNDGKRQKPTSLPNNSEWIGGKDGGVWIAFKSENEHNHLEFSIYQESGSLWVNTYFIGSCNFDKTVSLSNQIEAFDGENLIMKEKLPNGKNCLLKQLKN